MFQPALRGSRTVLGSPATANVQAKRFATLKDIAARIKSVKSIQKITKSMKMVSAAKFTRADRDLKNATALINSVTKHGIFSKINTEKKIDLPEDGPATTNHHLLVTISGDRGLCGGIHNNIFKYTKATLLNMPTSKIAVLGDKARGLLIRNNPNALTLSFSDINKRLSSFNTASVVANALIMNAPKGQFPHGYILYNEFKSAMSYEQTKIPIFSAQHLATAEEFALYATEDQTFQDYQEFTLATSLYASLVHAAASEQSARMQAMESSSKNASEMIDKLSVLYNRTRQTVITNELIEIISGAAAV